MRAPVEVEPYIWLQEDEKTGVAACGCTLDNRGDDGPALYRCETCVRAVEYHEELIRELEEVVTRCSDSLTPYEVSQIERLIRKAK